MEGDEGFLSPSKVSRRCKVEASPRKGTVELSPRRTPRSPLRPPATPPNWMRPHEVMRLHRLRRGSLASRFGRSEPRGATEQTWSNSTLSPPAKRKNPFRVDTGRNSPKKARPEPPDSSSVLRLLGLNDSQSLGGSRALDLQTIIDHIKQQSLPQGGEGEANRRSLPVDWSLRTKLRFMSTKPFPWSQTLRTCEEASGITGFVRCLSEDSECLDTSPNALFHKHCLYWQYPWLPWLRLYPRHQVDPSSRKHQNDKTLPSFASHPAVKETLHSDFTDSFTSVFQLVRARHCPYFYVVYNGFSCLFRAAGLGGAREITAMVCPTTLGFRQRLRDNDVEFSLPLKQDKKRRSCENEEARESPDVTTQKREEEEEEADMEDEVETRQWLSGLGLPTSQLDKLPSNTDGVVLDTESEGGDESLVCVEGGEVASLFNLLVNLRGCTASTGPSAGVPPTILSPVAFTGATLASLEVKESVVKGQQLQDSEKFYSMEVRGPVLPHAVLRLSHLLSSHLDNFSVACAVDHRTRPFSTAAATGAASLGSGGPAAFAAENLSDCGLDASLLATFCSSDVASFDSVKFSDGLYSLS